MVVTSLKEMEELDWQRLSKRLGECYTGADYDVIREFWMKDSVLPHAIRALDPETRVAGRLFTMLGRPDPTIGVHESVIDGLNS
jgi:4-hydroxy-4-methyl-2-oxoglutarate aldolase